MAAAALLCLVLGGAAQPAAAGDPDPAPQLRAVYERFNYAQGRWEAWTSHWDGSGARRIASASWGPLSWAPDGTRILFSHWNGKSTELMIATPDGEVVDQLTDNEVPEYRSAWAPDGSKISFLRGDDIRRPWVMNVDGSGQRKLGSFASSSAGLWSPTSRRIAFTTAQGELLVLRADGSDEDTPISFGDGAATAWSPDGQRILFTRWSRGYDIWLGDLSGEARPLFATDAVESGARWTADGENIIFQRGNDIWIADANGEGAVPLLDTPGRTETIIQQLPDTDLLAFMQVWIEVVEGPNIKHRELLTIPIDGSEPPTFVSTTPMLAALGEVPRCTVSGTGGDDVLVGTPGADVLCGREGRDRIVATSGDDTILGGAGPDTVDFRGRSSGVSVDLRDGVAGAGAMWGVETVLGSQHNDVLFGSDSRNVFASYGGNDALIGRAGDDTLLGGAGSDVLRPGSGGDDADGGDGQDTVSFIDAPSRVRVNLTDRFALQEGEAGDILTTLERVIGSSYDDFIVGDADRNVLKGGDGDDTINGQSGPDDIFGGGGRDSLFGRAGNDDLDGGAGNDYLNGGDGTDRCSSAYAAVQC